MGRNRERWAGSAEIAAASRSIPRCFVAPAPAAAAVDENIPGRGADGAGRKLAVGRREPPAPPGDQVLVLRKLSGRPGRGQSAATSRPSQESVTQAVLRSGPPKQMLVV